MWRRLRLLVVMCMLSSGYCIYSVVNATFPFKQIRALKKAATDQEAGYLNPAAAKTAKVYSTFLQRCRYCDDRRFYHLCWSSGRNLSRL